MIKKGTEVTWKWGNGSAQGKVEEVFHEDVSRRIDGNTIKRKAGRDDPAYMIKQDNGQMVIKSCTEVARK